MNKSNSILAINAKGFELKSALFCRVCLINF